MKKEYALIYQHFQFYVYKFYVHMQMQLLSINEFMDTHVNTLIVFIFQKPTEILHIFEQEHLSFFFFPFVLRSFTSPHPVKQEPRS